MCEMTIIGKKDCNNRYNEYIYGVSLLHVVPTTTTITSSEDMLFSLRERKATTYVSF